MHLYLYACLQVCSHSVCVCSHVYVCTKYAQTFSFVFICAHMSRYIPMCTAVATVCVGERSLCIPLMSIHVCATMLSLESHSDIFKDILPGDHGLPCDLASQPQGVGISRINIPCTFPILPPTPDLLGTGCVWGGCVCLSQN